MGLRSSALVIIRMLRMVMGLPWVPTVGAVRTDAVAKLQKNVKHVRPNAAKCLKLTWKIAKNMTFLLIRNYVVFAR